MYFFLLTTAHTLHALQVAGGTISYECIRPNQYHVTLTVYRDRYGINSGAIETINYQSVACGVNAILGLSLQSTTDITPFCPSAQS